MTIPLPQTINLTKTNLISAYICLHVGWALITHFIWVRKIHEASREQRRKIDTGVIVGIFFAVLLAGFPCAVAQVLLYGPMWLTRFLITGQTSRWTMLKRTVEDGLR